MKRTFISIAAVLMLVPIAAIAHHSFAAEYDANKPLNLVGVINKIDQQNPHGFIYLNVPPATAGGRVTNWALETPGPNQLVRTFTKEMYTEMIDKKEVDGAFRWDGACKALLSELESIADEAAKRSASWPKTPRGLSGKLRRISTFMRDAGVEITFQERASKGQRPLTIEKRLQTTVTTVIVTSDE